MNTLSIVRNVISVIIITLLLSSCGLFGGEKRPVYQGAEYYKNLEVPPDLTAPDTADELRVAKPTDEALARFRDNNKLETVITPKFDGVRTVSYAGDSWIEVDDSVERVWPALINFWEGEGVKLVEQRPLLGYMETDWVKRLNPDSGFFRSMFQHLEPDEKDKFRVRVESMSDEDNAQQAKTRIFVTHSRIERVTSGEFGEEYIWQSRPSDVEAEREIISRLVLYAGLNKDQMSQLLENYRPYTSLVKIDKTNTSALTMAGSMDFVWRRAMRALDRMKMRDIAEQKQSSSIHFTVGEISDKDIQVEHDELTESSWIMRMFTGVDEKNLASNENRKYRLELSEIKGRIQIEVIDAKDSQTTDEDGDVSGTALAQQIRDILANNLE